MMHEAVQWDSILQWAESHTMVQITHAVGCQSVQVEKIKDVMVHGAESRGVP